MGLPALTCVLVVLLSGGVFSQPERLRVFKDQNGFVRLCVSEVPSDNVVRWEYENRTLLDCRAKDDCHLSEQAGPPFLFEYVSHCLRFNAAISGFYGSWLAKRKDRKILASFEVDRMDVFQHVISSWPTNSDIFVCPGRPVPWDYRIDWYFNGLLIYSKTSLLEKGTPRSESRFEQRLTDFFHYCLKISGSQNDDAGEFALIAQKEDNSILQTVTIQIKAATLWSKEVTAEADSSFVVGAGLWKEFNFRLGLWYHNGTLFRVCGLENACQAVGPDRFANRAPMVEKYSLLIKDVKPGDSGRYRLVTSSALESRVITYEVQELVPESHQGPQRVEVVEFSSAELCAPKPAAAIGYSWVFNNETFYECETRSACRTVVGRRNPVFGRFRLSDTTARTASGEKILHCLRLTSALRQQAGDYQVTFFDENGSLANWQFKLTVEVKVFLPNTTRKQRVSSLEGRNVTLCSRKPNSTSLSEAGSFVASFQGAVLFECPEGPRCEKQLSRASGSFLSWQPFCLTLFGVVQSDSGLYVLSSFHGEEPQSDSFELNVVQVEERTVVAESSLTLCASGPLPEKSNAVSGVWAFNSKTVVLCQNKTNCALTGEARVRYKNFMPINVTCLTIDRVSTQNAGPYFLRVKVDGAVNQVAAFNLIVEHSEEKPDPAEEIADEMLSETLYLNPPVVKSRVGDSVKLCPKNEEGPFSKIIWVAKGKKVFDCANGVRCEPQQIKEPWRVSIADRRCYFIQDVRLSDGGAYVFFFKTGRQVVTGRIDLIVHRKGDRVVEISDRPTISVERATQKPVGTSISETGSPPKIEDEVAVKTLPDPKIFPILELKNETTGRCRARLECDVYGLDESEMPQFIWHVTESQHVYSRGLAGDPSILVVSSENTNAKGIFTCVVRKNGEVKETSIRFSNVCVFKRSKAVMYVALGVLLGLLLLIGVCVGLFFYLQKKGHCYKPRSQPDVIPKEPEMSLSVVNENVSVQ
ncbi:putative carcinoembryonic antigen-related cell adhesion molecule 1 isoform protein [Chelonid alphaherpesvirus 5]|uniref:Putative carcinoembryonic antigen-related cell adhesion molecule 1 isoform protein n=1 Tax=Chelonid alphaherpesvirus 5 TaxID=702736 RepID=V5NWN3_9ALPH|nr:putative carcinoembryonic antigen-related cell adhesion molecule 1 isoform protein [Chelonid alphaherpesvirus 5]AHA93307.1 putative carcinoembryonic antigen-related cell adhesion molecule 1 isoform protein [Chelonid alphaherpesvirus 5]